MNWRLHKLVLWTLLTSAINSQLNGQCTITITEDNPCSGAEVTIGVDDPDVGADYSWDLDNDGTVDLQGSVFFDYSFPEVFTDQTFTITLFRDGSSCSSLSVPVKAAPDVSIGVPQGTVTLEGNELKACGANGTLDLQLFNASTTIPENVTYTINWGDGSPSETFDNNTFNASSTISHVYNGFGYFPIFLSVEHTNGCVYTKNYTLYNGGNPSVGLATPGNTVGLCAPATLTFPITNTAGNPPGTEYRIYINGAEVARYDQDDLPPSFTYTFDNHSCGKETSTGNYQNAFDLRIVASNPCNSSAATIEPIEVSTPPEPLFEVTPPAYSCTGAIYGFSNSSSNINEVRSGDPSSCLEILSPNWTISGTAGSDWEIVSGNLFNSNNLDIRFLEPGTYTIEMTIVSFACGTYTYTQDIDISEQADVEGESQVIDVGEGPNGEPCSPYKFEMNSTTSGEILSYSWQVESDQDWDFIEGTTADSPDAKFIFYGGGDYNVKLSVANACATVEWDTLITLEGRPTAVLDIPNACDQATLNFDNSLVSYGDNGYSIDSYDWTFEGAETTSSSDANPSNIAYNSPGEYVVRLRVANTCGSVTVRDTFLIQPKDDLMLPPDQTLCATEPAFMLDAGLAGGTWSGSGVLPNGQFNPGAATAGVNTLTYSFGSGVCFVEEQMNITVNPEPVVDIGEDQEVCISVSSVSLPAEPEGGIWTSLDGGVLNGDQFMVQETPPGEYKFRYDFVDENGCEATDIIQVEVTNGPVITAPDTAYCNTPKDQALPPVSILGGTWTGPGVTGESSFNPFTAGGAGVYDLNYFYANPVNGCESSVPIQVSVIDPVKVDAGEDLAICETLDVVLLDSLASPPGGSWTFNGNPLTEAVFDPSQQSNGVYKFAYAVGNGVCVVTDTLEIEIADLEPFELDADQVVCSEADQIQLSGSGGLPGIWSGAGIVDSVGGFFDPADLSPGEYPVTFTRVDDNVACPGEDTKLVTIQPLPTPSFVIPGSVCIDLEFTPANESTGATNYSWDFGDGTTSTNSNVSHQYTDFGDYIVSLEAQNDLGCAATYLDTIVVAPPPAASFDVVDDEGCGPLRLNFNDTSEGAGITYEWDFGNGQTSTRAVPVEPIIYTSSRRDTSYIVSLRVANGCGADISRDTILVHPFPKADFAFTVDTGCAPIQLSFANLSQGSPESWFWDFGNGVTSTNELPAPQLFTAGTIPLTYDITLVTTNACGTDSLSKPLVVYPQEVQAFFNLDNAQGCAPFDVRLENFSTPAELVQWDFGDGQIGSGNQTNHLYTEPGQYTIKLKIGNGCTEDSTTATIEVLASPELQFAHSPNLCTEQEIFFSNDSGPLSNLQWDFGTGETSQLANPTYEFPSTGTYTISLSGSIGETGCTDTLTKQLTIVEPPEAQIQGVDLEGCAPYPATFSSQGSVGDFYRWDFGDGNGSTDQNPQHIFPAAGNYTVRLTVSSMQGCEADTILSGITVFPSPDAAFSIPDQICGLPAELTLENLSVGADDYTWTLSNGTISELRSPMLVIDEGQVLDINLLVANQFGCQDTVSNAIEVRDQAVADFILEPGTGCDPLPVAFTNYSQGNQFEWDFGDGNFSAEEQPVHTYTEPGTYTVNLIASFNGVCRDTLDFMGEVNVLASPFANFDWIPVTQNGQTSREINFVNQSEDAVSYFWDFGDGTTSTEENPSHLYGEGQTWQVLLQATNSLGCVDDTLLVVEPSFIGRLYVPNAFAPLQGVGEAQLFLPKGIGLKEYQLQIFSPYGELLWESTTLDNGQPAEGWDGTHNGHLLPQDVYVWKIKGVFEDGSQWLGRPTNGGSYKRLGSVTLIR
ncbi:MAG: PKD domain-containing protein [Saprospiraceae bacterium]|nr:PKD domain-containing protein [Saprospiraceae bacterium]